MTDITAEEWAQMISEARNLAGNDTQVGKRIRNGECDENENAHAWQNEGCDGTEDAHAWQSEVDEADGGPYAEPQSSVKVPFVVVRQELVEFVRLMENRLTKNGHVLGQERSPIQHLTNKLVQASKNTAISVWSCRYNDTDSLEARKDLVILDAVDAAICAMMIVDRVGGLGEQAE